MEPYTATKLNSVILVSPFQLRIFYDSVIHMHRCTHRRQHPQTLSNVDKWNTQPFWDCRICGWSRLVCTCAALYSPPMLRHWQKHYRNLPVHSWNVALTYATSDTGPLLRAEVWCSVRRQWRLVEVSKFGGCYVFVLLFNLADGLPLHCGQLWANSLPDVSEFLVHACCWSSCSFSLNSSCHPGCLAKSVP